METTIFYPNDRRKYSLEKIIEILTVLYSEKDYFRLLEVMLTNMMDLNRADAGTLYIAEGKLLHFRIMRNKSLNIFRNEDIDLPPIVLDKNSIHNVSAYAALKKEIVIIDDVYNDKRFNLDGPKKYDKMTGYHTKSMLVLPLKSTFEDIDSVTGVIQLINAKDENGEIIPFGDIYNPPILPALASISSNILGNIIYVDEIKEMFNSFVEVMAEAIDERSPYNKSHTYNVAKYCTGFVDYLNTLYPSDHRYYFDMRRREQLKMSAYLHDIGKIITPLEIMDKSDRLGSQFDLIKLRVQIKVCQIENAFLKKEINQDEYRTELSRVKDGLILAEKINRLELISDDDIIRVKELANIYYTDESGNNTPVFSSDHIASLMVRKGTLTDEERSIMQEHASITSRLLGKMSFNKYYRDVPGWASKHHEYIDGTGYPECLSGDLVTTEVRILTMIDIYDALTAHDRPYKKELSCEDALNILNSMADNHKLDKELVVLFVDYIKSEK